MSRKSVASGVRSLSGTGTILLSSKSDNTDLSPLRQIVCQEDVITNFFNQIVEFAIEDMIIIESKETLVEEPAMDMVVVKDYKDLQEEDLVNSEIVSVSGSKVSLKKKSFSSEKRRKSKIGPSASNLSVIKEEELDKSRSKVSTATTSSSLMDPLMEEEREVKIFFTNGNIYEGRIAKRIMNGKGKYMWANGTSYEGDFKDGFPTGKGVMTLPDLSRYKGEFNHGLFNGEGFLNMVSTPSFYSGQWKNGLKHGQGWLFYSPNDWYEGGWLNDLKHGFGVRHYKKGGKYRGTWSEGKYDGHGLMIWDNNDYYKGEWAGGAMDGEGQYIWKAFYNKTFTFPIQNIYRGSWRNGKRCGEGVMHFGGDSGAKLKGFWDQDFKHGDGYLICGNGMVVEQHDLFHFDKPVHPHWDQKDGYKILDVPIFNIPELVDVGFYVDKILEKIPGANPDKLAMLKMFEEKCIKNTIIVFLPKLNDLYKSYATIATNEELQYEPVLVRMFLWQLYKDIGISKFGLSLVDTDKILADNPQSSLETLHYPFEPIYYWQFLMSLIGVALTTSSLEDAFDAAPQSGVSAFIIKKFFEETLGAKPLDKGSHMFAYMDLVPIKSVYALYQKLGEPHTAKTFLRHTCTRRGEVPLLCYSELHSNKLDEQSGINLVPLAEYITFDGKPSTKLGDGRNWSNLYDFRHLGPKNIVRCLGKACPLIVVEDLVVNMDYPLTFLEFYDTLLACIFLVLELELKKEKKILSQVVEPRTRMSTSSKRRSSLKIAESQKKIHKVDKKASKTKKK